MNSFRLKPKQEPLLLGEQELVDPCSVLWSDEGQGLLVCSAPVMGLAYTSFTSTVNPEMSLPPASSAAEVAGAHLETILGHDVPEMVPVRP